jgi:hypothetical protein
MKYRKRDIILSELIVLFISTLVSTILIALIAITPVPKIIVPIFWIMFIFLMNYFLIVNPGKILLMGYLQIRTPVDFQVYVNKFLAKYIERSTYSHVLFHVIEDDGYVAMYFADLRSIHLVFSSKLVHEWNEIDVESALLYISALQKHTLPLRDTSILVLATIAERFIITSFLGAALIHLVRSHTNDSIIDREAVIKMKYSMGYQNMLSKMRSGEDSLSKLPASFGMNGIGDISKKSVNKALYAVHESIDTRIEEIKVLNAEL